VQINSHHQNKILSCEVFENGGRANPQHKKENSTGVDFVFEHYELNTTRGLCDTGSPYDYLTNSCGIDVEVEALCSPA